MILSLEMSYEYFKIYLHIVNNRIHWQKEAPKPYSPLAMLRTHTCPASLAPLACGASSCSSFV